MLELNERCVTAHGTIFCPNCGNDVGLYFLPLGFGAGCWMQCTCGYGEDILGPKKETVQ